MSKEIDAIERRFLDTFRLPMVSKDVANDAFKLATVKLLSVIARQLSDLNDKTPDGC